MKRRVQAKDLKRNDFVKRFELDKHISGHINLPVAGVLYNNKNKVVRVEFKDGSHRLYNGDTDMHIERD